MDPELTPITPSEQEPVIRLTISRQISEGYGFGMETFVARGCEPAELHSLQDKMANAIQRQYNRHLLDVMKKNILEYKEQQRLAEEAVVKIDFSWKQKMEKGADGRRVPMDLPKTAVTERENAVANVEFHEKRIRQFEAQMVELERSLG